jgi:transcription elongation factor Elf1
MPYFECPRCGEESVQVILTAYEPDTNAGGCPEIVSVVCGCDLTPDEQDKVYAEADTFDDWYGEG